MMKWGGLKEILLWIWVSLRMDWITFMKFWFIPNPETGMTDYQAIKQLEEYEPYEESKEEKMRKGQEGRIEEIKQKQKEEEEREELHRETVEKVREDYEKMTPEEKEE